MEQGFDVDDIWRALGPWGRYQKGQLAFMWLGMIPCSVHLMSTVFTGYRPHFWCDVPESSNVSYTAAIDDCHVTTNYNNSNITSFEDMACPYGFRFDEQTDISIVTEWNLVCTGAEKAELSQSLLMLGQGVGAIMFTGLSDKFGRKPVHVFSHLSLFLLTLALALSPTINVYSTLKFFIGMAIEGFDLTMATQYVETLPMEWRFYSEVVALLVWTTGIILVTPFAYFLRGFSWRYLQLALALLSTYSLVEYWLFDESLRWLMANGKLVEAERVVRMAAKRNGKTFDDVIEKVKALQRDIDYTLVVKSNMVSNKVEDEMLNDSSNQTEEATANIVHAQQTGELAYEYMPASAIVKKYTMIDILKDRTILLNSSILWLAWITNTFTYYGLGLSSAALFGNRYINYFLVGASEYGSAFAEFMLLNRIGRKKTIILMFSIAATGLLVSILLTSFGGGDATMLSFSVVFYLLGKLAITAAFSSTFLYTPELYPTNLRNSGYGFASVFARVGGVLAPFTGTLSQLVSWGPGVVYCSLCGLTSVLMTRLPETKGRELPTTIDELKAWYHTNTPGFKFRKKKVLIQKETDL